MSPITTHVLDTAAGRPAAGVPVTLWLLDDGYRKPIGQSHTDADGRCRDLLPGDHALAPGSYSIEFDVDRYFAGRSAFYRLIAIAFEVREAGEHYHVPLLLSPFGYSTYRGS